MTTPPSTAETPEVPSSETAAPEAPGTPGGFPSSRRLLLGLFVGAALLGYAAERWLWPVSHPGGQEPTPGAAPDAGSSDESAAARQSLPQPPASGLPDLSTPIPSTREALAAEAMSVADRLLAVFPERPDSWEIKARLMEWLGNSKEAVKCWQKCLDINPNYAYAYLGMGTLASRKDDHQRAIESLQKAVQLDPNSFMVRLALAQQLLDAVRPKEAIAALEDFLRKDPRSQGFFLLGQAYFQLNDLEKARENFEAAVRKHPQFTEAYHRLSMVYARMQQKDKAEEASRKARSLRAGDHESRLLQRAQRDDPVTMRRTLAQIYVYAARVYQASDRRREAEELLRRAAQYAPDDVECRQGLAFLCRMDGRTPAAIQVLEELAKLAPANPNYWLEIGRLRAELILFNEAEEALRKAVSIAPHRADSHAELARLYLDFSRKLPEALASAREAVERQPTASHYAVLAAACNATGDLAGALAALQQALKLEPNNAKYREVYETLKKRLPGNN